MNKERQAFIQLYAQNPCLPWEEKVWGKLPPRGAMDDDLKILRVLLRRACGRLKQLEQLGSASIATKAQAIATGHYEVKEILTTTGTGRRGQVDTTKLVRRRERVLQEIIGLTREIALLERVRAYVEGPVPVGPDAVGRALREL